MTKRFARNVIISDPLSNTLITAIGTKFIYTVYALKPMNDVILTNYLQYEC